MPRLAVKFPKYCRHSTGSACVYVSGKVVYLGEHGSAESKARYREFIAKLAREREAEAAAPPTPAGTTYAPPALTLAEGLVHYKRHCEGYYNSRELHNLREALKPLREWFGTAPLIDFGPMQLRKVRDSWIKKGLSRHTINARVGRVRRFFKYCVGYELAPSSVLERLGAVEPLMRGRGGREVAPRKPVSWEDVEATLPHLNRVVSAMVLFGWHTGARPGEIVGLTTGAIEAAGEVWTARLARHKNEWRGLEREILIGKAAQLVLDPWLRPDAPDAAIFSPLLADDRQPKRKGPRRPGKVYSRAAFSQAVRRGCERAGVPLWSPNQLRHAAATRLRDAHGIEVAQVVLGHARPDTTLIYTSLAKARAVEAIRTQP
ncbi:tyrosine-type recombinase/integrase [Paludisphaera rhizosphaerae]|uniref:tyrosine-type recombinase/integrase n=1 Tax=Paludisphaera rhizosphaerae TaxID=2711216 RepID=UPI0013EA4E68|nr:site-specific integrase [Paludisphaera rhizosphaerae]